MKKISMLNIDINYMGVYKSSTTVDIENLRQENMNMYVNNIMHTIESFKEKYSMFYINVEHKGNRIELANSIIGSTSVTFTTEENSDLVDASLLANLINSIYMELKSKIDKKKK